jgi:hypothetical protein
MARPPQPHEGDDPIRCILVAVAALFCLVLWHPAPGQAQTPGQLRAETYRTDPCLAHIVDNEDGRWDPTIDFGGGHGNVYESYGLVQANPGTKMASAGADWRTNPLTQLRWGRMYAIQRYGSTCAAWAWWQAHRWW